MLAEELVARGYKGLQGLLAEELLAIVRFEMLLLVLLIGFQTTTGYCYGIDHMHAYIHEPQTTYTHADQLGPLRRLDHED